MFDYYSTSCEVDKLSSVVIIKEKIKKRVGRKT